jgi:hypothetical protein
MNSKQNDYTAINNLANATYAVATQAMDAGELATADALIEQYIKLASKAFAILSQSLDERVGA